MKATAIVLVCAACSQGADTFVVFSHVVASPHGYSGSALLHSSTTEQPPPDNQMIPYFDDLVQAVDCASHFGQCDVQTLHDLADKVDSGYSDDNDMLCMYETTPELCDKEIQDRKDVAKLLRLQAELQLGMEYLENANLFAANVRDERNVVGACEYDIATAE